MASKGRWPGGGAQVEVATVVTRVPVTMRPRLATLSSESSDEVDSEHQVNHTAMVSRGDTTDMVTNNPSAPTNIVNVNPGVFNNVNSETNNIANNNKTNISDKSTSTMTTVSS